MSLGPRGLRWTLRQGLVQGLLLYSDSSGVGLWSPLLPAKHILAELGGVHAPPAGCGHAETPLEEPLQDLPGKKQGSAKPRRKSLPPWAWWALARVSYLLLTGVWAQPPAGQPQKGQGPLRDKTWMGAIPLPSGVHNLDWAPLSQTHGPGSPSLTEAPAAETRPLASGQPPASLS